MIQEYRKASAEALGIEIHPWHYFHPQAEMSKDELLYFRNKHDVLVAWIPDSDANQILMVWEWLTKNQKCNLVIFIDEIYTSVKMYNNKMIENAETIDSHSVKSIFIATMKAFMEYYQERSLI